MQGYNRQSMGHGMYPGLLTGFVDSGLVDIELEVSIPFKGLPGDIWHDIRWPRRAEIAAFLSLFYRNYISWLVLFIAAELGTTANNPLTSTVDSTRRWQGAFVANAFLSISIATLATSVFVLCFEALAWLQ